MAKIDIEQDRYKTKPLVVMPLGDIQWAGKNGSTALELLKSRIAIGMELDALFLGCGDYIDTFSPSNRQRLRSAALYDTAMNAIDNAADALNEEIFELALKPTRGRWLGMLEGHHFHQYDSGDTSDQRLCKMLNARFLGTSAYIGLDFKRGAASNIINIWATHGCGSGATAGAPVTKLERILTNWEAHIFVMGHMTKMASAPINRVYPAWHKGPRLSHRTIQLVGAGGFSKGYELGAKQGNIPRGSYVEQGMMKPTALGSPIIRIAPRRVRSSVNGKEHEEFNAEITVEL